MSEFTLLSDFSLDTTSLSNIYIDEYMPQNNESQVKIYLYLLRNLGSKGVSVASIADAFNYSTKDVERALIFMQNQGLMSLDEKNGNIVGLRLLPLTRKTNEVIVLSSKPEYSNSQIMEFTNNPEISQLIFVIEQYIGKTLSPQDINSLLYMNQTLGFNEEVIEYLIEYCVGLKKKSFRYFEKVAKDWSDNGVKTIDDAKDITYSCPKDVYEVFKSFGIKSSNRKPSYNEIKFVNKWVNEYAFSHDIIKKACDITVNKTHSASFEYADAVLSDWHKKGVKHLSDIDSLMNVRTFSSKAEKNTDNSQGSFSRGNYNFEELERELLSN